MTRRAFLIPVLAVLVLAAPAVPALAGEVEHEHWYAVYIGEKKAGHSHERLERTKEDGREVWVTTSESEFSMLRMGQTVTIVQKSTIVEDGDGLVLRFEASQAMGTVEQKTTGTVKDGKVQVTKMGMPTTVDYPEGALGPRAIAMACKKSGLESGTRLEVQTFSAEAPNMSLTQTFTVGAEEKKDILGRVLMLHRVDVTNSLMPVPMSVWVDGEWTALAIEMDIPGIGKFRGFATEKEIATAKSEPAEVFTTTLVAPDRKIPGARTLAKGVYRLGKKGGTLDEIYEGEGQRILGKKDGKLQLEILNDEPGEGFKAAALPFAKEGVENYLKPAPYVECEDAEVVKLAKEAVGDETDALLVARRIEAYVRRKISKKNLNVGFASAAEVARTLEGDCTEHGVLCAAIARAVGLPSRVVTGLVYVPGLKGPDGGTNGAFGFHMWTEVLITKDRWYAIDAAIGDYDATHIALQKSDLSELNPQVEMMLKMLPVLGSLTIEVVEPK